jgi:hypothetical protein
LSQPIDPQRIGHLVSADLLKALRETFPMQRPLRDDNERDIWIRSGNQEVIEFLTQQHEQALAQAIGA